jgi:hypothetical protein
VTVRNRSTTDILILMIASTICFAVLASGATIAFIEIRSNGDADTSVAFKSVQDVLNTLIGLLAGFLAGRTQSTLDIQRETRRMRKQGADDAPVGDE